MLAILYQMHAKKAVDIKPTEGYNVESLKVGGFLLNVWDIRGQDDYRNFWRHYYTGTQGLVFVIDSCDTERLKTSREEIIEVLADEQLMNAAILILANKQDQPGAVSPEKISKIFNLDALINKRPLKIQGSTATTGDGLVSGFTWLAKNMRSL
jgi:ADP-ribosylation factor 6